MKLDEISKQPPGNRPGRKPITTKNIKDAFDSIRQDMSNATIDVEPYNSASFRANRIKDVIDRLTTLYNQLMTDAAVEKAQVNGVAHGSAIEKAKK